MSAKRLPPPLIVCFAGYSGSGKTSLLERVVPALGRQGLQVGYLKANAHRIDIDREGKDTDRMRRAGAAAIAIQGRDTQVHFPGPNVAQLPPRIHSDPKSIPRSEPHLDPKRSLAPDAEGYSFDYFDHTARIVLWNLRSLYSRVDVLLVEGMKASRYPKILVDRRDNPRGILGPDRLRNVVVHLDWPSLPEDWDEPVERAVAGIVGLVRDPARNHAHNLIGAVLAGGGSRRMGRDKADLPLFPIDSKSDAEATATTPDPSRATWLERAHLLLAEICPSVWIVGRTAAAGDKTLPSLDRPVSTHLDLRPDAGPLGGLETALRLAGGDGVLAVPCDLPRLPIEALHVLLAGRDGDSPAVAFRRPDGRREPAVLVVEARAAKNLSQFLDSGERKLDRFLDSIGVRWLDLPDEFSGGFENFNTPEDLVRFGRTNRKYDVP